MPRHNLTGGWGESRVMTVRLAPEDDRRLAALTEAWNMTASEVLRRALQEAADRERNPRRECDPER